MSDEALAAVFIIGGALFAFWLYILLPANMAAARGRSAFGWVLLSLLFSPILACLLLMLLGNNPNSRR
jgi:hypothetical protein